MTDICGPCGRTHGFPPDRGIGMWIGDCAICGTRTALADAWHDYGLIDSEVERIKVIRSPRKGEA